MNEPIHLPDRSRSDHKASLEDAGWKLTRQRAAVFHELQEAAGHPTAEALHRGVKLTRPSISLATVYKAPEALVDSGMVTRLLTSSGSARFDARKDHHDHLRCLRSGAVEDVPTDLDTGLIAKIDPGLGDRIKVRGLQVTGYRLELVGYFDEPEVS